ncbi:MAG: type II secretion system protein GspE [Verrucomicrobia bacterium CG_4_10_14_3_um_filter_43_23]|nr:MAG: hypothetical protein AUJ82_05775 [Verrucomicrobia bacterium CG1_02_43_26]PIP60010.1 MAG: type II secretion system protein GspE [Verrucomicrobia bacterium CG22_combo_CG10-13_8_21_14_all_43_17]PIX58128.1 MAG: type II secretion system protein GspE [Verrucomicrobia bacterium CG_4_10_14_3_um_filter_43_23]PIY60990.1 MAG: type II secretion system protein GspE [Verrucomicrobia bacterium CG_4_10_14_0_8_um_filter_43_34]PJA43568.1 MAG: type II secretion system protein GspE [Verrucomicrobia bacteri
MKSIDDILDPVLLRRFDCFPLELKDQTLYLAVSKHFEPDTVDTLTDFTGYQIVTETYPDEFIEEKLQSLSKDNTASQVTELSEPLAFFRDIKNPIEHYLQSVIHAAIRKFASDIHFEPQAHTFQIRFRKDGIMSIYQEPDKHLATPVISRLKLLSHVNIAERRVPQDGRFAFSYEGRELDVRASFVPALHGESAVLRLLDKEQHERLNLSSLGMAAHHLKLLRDELDRSEGLVLVTGPTGSGKTTTLYAALQELNKRSKKIITVEDPVEYKISGVNQVSIVPKVNRTFERSLRAILRQSPDVIMIGEIRDTETANITIEASLTGHLVLSTLHTNDAPSAIMRLVDLGAQSFLIDTALSLIISQRLVRVVCSECVEFVPAGEYEKLLLGQLGKSFEIPKAVGCESCSHTGYQGRTGIFEMLKIDDVLSEMIYQRSSLNDIYDYLKETQWQSIHADAIDKVLTGTTTLNEILTKVDLLAAT